MVCSHDGSCHLLSGVGSRLESFTPGTDWEYRYTPPGTGSLYSCTLTTITVHCTVVYISDSLQATGAHHWISVILLCRCLNMDLLLFPLTLIIIVLPNFPNSICFRRRNIRITFLFTNYHNEGRKSLNVQRWRLELLSPKPDLNEYDIWKCIVYMQNMLCCYI